MIAGRKPTAGASRIILVKFYRPECKQFCAEPVRAESGYWRCAVCKGLLEPEASIAVDKCRMEIDNTNTIGKRVTFIPEPKVTGEPKWVPEEAA